MIDVLLAEAPGSAGWLLRTDPAHPVVYDHVMDHVPGNAIVEAARQAAYVALGRSDATVVRAELSFARYVEFDSPCQVFAEQTGDTTATRAAVRVEFVQSAHVVATGMLELAISDLPPGGGGAHDQRLVR